MKDLVEVVRVAELVVKSTLEKLVLSLPSIFVSADSL
jgi:hypothetical protein